MPKSWTLVVRTTLSSSLDLAYQDRGLLVTQLAFFKTAGLGNPYFVHEFHNESGALIAFLSRTYLSHSVVPPDPDFL